MKKALREKVLLSALLLTCLGVPVVAQDPAPPKEQQPPAQGNSNDPFSRPTPKATKVPEQKDAGKPVLVPFPTLDQRRAEFQVSRQAAIREDLGS